MYEYRCKILRVVDGDTVDVDIDLGFNIWVHNERMRLYGIDAPETRTTNQIEKAHGVYAKELVESLLPEGSCQVIKTIKDTKGKFGRILADFIIDGSMLTEILLKERAAIVYGYDTETKRIMHEENYKYLVDAGKITLTNQ